MLYSNDEQHTRGVVIILIEGVTKPLLCYKTNNGKNQRSISRHQYHSGLCTSISQQLSTSKSREIHIVMDDMDEISLESNISLVKVVKEKKIKRYARML